MTLYVLDPAKLTGAPETFPKGWGAADWDAPDDVDVLAALLGAVVTAATPDAVALVSIDPTYPAAIQLPAAIIALEPGHGIPLPAGEVGILAGQGGERKSTLTIQMAIAAAAAEDGALVSPFTGRAVDPDDPFQVGAVSRCAGDRSAWPPGKTRRRGSPCAPGRAPSTLTANPAPNGIPAC